MKPGKQVFTGERGEHENTEPIYSTVAIIYSCNPQELPGGSKHDFTHSWKQRWQHPSRGWSAPAFWICGIWCCSSLVGWLAGRREICLVSWGNLGFEYRPWGREIHLFMVRNHTKWGNWVISSLPISTFERTTSQSQIRSYDCSIHNSRIGFRNNHPGKHKNLRYTLRDMPYFIVFKIPCGKLK